MLCLHGASGRWVRNRVAALPCGAKWFLNMKGGLACRDGGRVLFKQGVCLTCVCRVGCAGDVVAQHHASRERTARPSYRSGLLCRALGVCG